MYLPPRTLRQLNFHIAASKTSNFGFFSSTPSLRKHLALKSGPYQPFIVAPGTWPLFMSQARRLIQRSLCASANSSSVLDSPAHPMTTKWTSLKAPRSELRLDFTLPTGQSFRWRKSGENEYTGVIGPRVVRLRQLENDVEYIILGRSAGASSSATEEDQIVRDYFNLDHVKLATLSDQWAAADARFKAVRPYFEGARMLRQDPLECLFSFICSQNNHISRIHSMVERLCSDFGTEIELEHEIADPPSTSGRPQISDAKFYAFPTLDQLSGATDEGLRAAGFGYRAKYIVAAAKFLKEKEQGWLLGLRSSEHGLPSAVEALISVPGIGPKVAGCVALFSLDKHDSIPVDVHVWQLAIRYYAPELQGKSLTKKVHQQVQAAFESVFGPYCGWAHNTLFISELASLRHLLPEDLRPPPTPAKPKKKKAKLTEGEEEEIIVEDEEEEEDGVSKYATPSKKSGATATGKGGGRTPTAGKTPTSKPAAAAKNSEGKGKKSPAAAGGAGAEGPKRKLSAVRNYDSDE